jgi:hypothetical protein
VSRCGLEAAAGVAGANQLKHLNRLVEPF